MPGLNEAQREAVTWREGPALVLAGAGSGKTRVIVERIVQLIDEHGVDPRRVLALTFTNRAAGEMKSRVADQLGRERVAAWIGTFHSFGLYVLRRDIDKLGRPKQFTIYDDGDQLALVKRIIKGLPTSFERVSPREALYWIGGLKQDLEVPDFDAEPEDAEDETFREVWKQYHGALERASGVDFDDLLALPARLFEEHEEVLARYRHRFQYLLVDEYQDTNRAQYVLARALSGPAGNIFVVGDEDQSIYSWRGADIRNILDFETDFPGARVFRLEQNYRSTKPILEAANAVVAHNVDRLGKTLWTDREDGDLVEVYRAEDAESEAEFIVDTIKSRGLPPGRVAVLYRTNTQARIIEEACLRKGLPYLVVGSARFYSRKEIKDLLAYLRLVVNPADEVSFRRIVNVPPRGIGGVTLQRIEDAARARGISLLDSLRHAAEDESLGARARGAAETFVRIVDDLALEAQDKSVAHILDRLLEETGYREFVEKSDEKDFRTRLELIDEFVSSCAGYDAKGGEDLLGFLQELSLLSDTDDIHPDIPAVTLMTCHSAKGLEFDHIILTGLEEGLLPHASSMDSGEEIEEERRLCYVAMTRARKSLLLTWAESRVIYGERQAREASRFLGEIPEGSLREIGAGTRARGKMAPSRHAVADPGEISTGTHVRHAKFGRGVVMYTSGSGSKTKVRIRFDTGMSRQFMLSAAPIEIVKGKRP